MRDEQGLQTREDAEQQAVTEASTDRVIVEEVVQCASLQEGCHQHQISRVRVY